MKTSHRVIIKSDKRTGIEKPCFSAVCPTLGVADDGDTFEEALANLQKLIKFHLECLVKEKEVTIIVHNKPIAKW